MILTDTSVLIDYSRTGDLHLHALFLTLPVAVCGIEWAEVLSGTRTVNARSEAMRILTSFKFLPIPDSLWEKVGDNRSLLLSKGLSVPFNDVVLATLAIELDIEVWARDLHFPQMQIHLPRLKLFVEPPP